MQVCNNLSCVREPPTPTLGKKKKIEALEYHLYSGAGGWELGSLFLFFTNSLNSSLGERWGESYYISSLRI